MPRLGTLRWEPSLTIGRPTPGTRTLKPLEGNCEASGGAAWALFVLASRKSLVKRPLIDAKFHETYYFASIVHEVLTNQWDYLDVVNAFCGEGKHLEYWALGHLDLLGEMGITELRPDENNTSLPQNLR